MTYFPLFIDIENKNILIIGAGKIAYRKITKLIPFKPKITIVAPNISDEIKNLLKENKNLTYKNKKVDIDDIKDSFFVICATNDKTINNFVSKFCKENNIFVNCVDDIENCSFVFPALIKKPNLTIGISTCAKAPYFSAYLKKLIKNSIPKNTQEIIENLELIRTELKQKIKTQEKRAKIIHNILDYYKENNFQLSYDNLKEKINNLINEK